MPIVQDAEHTSGDSRVEPLARVLGANEYDVFLSYSRRDQAVAEALFRQLPAYRPPRSIAAPRRALRVFRDVHDIAGTVLEASLHQHLDHSARLIVLCSPASRASRYVDAEIRYYQRMHGAHRIVPVLVGGVPNGEAADEADRAFPQALLEAMGGDPLAVDFRGLDPARPRMARGRFRPAWFQLLANLYGIPQRELQARERARTRRHMAAAAAFVVLLAIAAGAWTAYARSDGYQVRRVVADAPGVISQAGDSTAAAWLDALLATGRHDAALSVARSVQDPLGRSRALAGLARDLAAARRRDAALAAANGAVAAGEAVRAPQDQALALAEASAVLAALGQAAPAARAAERAVAAAGEPFIPADMSDFRDGVLRQVALTLANAGQAPQARAAARAIQDLQDPQRVSTLGDVAAALARAGRRREAAATAAEVLAAAEAEPWHHQTASIAFARVGEIPRALATARAIEAPDVRAFALSGVAAALAEARDARAAQAAAEAVAAARSIRETPARSQALASVARELAEAGQAPDAVEAAREELAAIRERMPPGLAALRAQLPEGQSTAFSFSLDLDDRLAAVADVLARAGQARDALAAATLIDTPFRLEAVLDSVAHAVLGAGDPAASVAAVRAMRLATIRAEAFARLAPALARAGHAAHAAGALREGLAAARALPAPRDRVTALAGMAAAMHAAGQGEDAARVARESLALARTVDEPYQRPRAMREAAAALLVIVPGEAAGAVRDAVTAAIEDDNVEELGLLAIALARAGQADAAGQAVRHARDATGRIEVPADRVAVLQELAGALAAAGSTEAAAEVALAADSVALRMTDAEARSAALANVATRFARAGWLWRARQVADRDALRPDDRLRAYTAILLGGARPPSATAPDSAAGRVAPPKSTAQAAGGAPGGTWSSTCTPKPDGPCRDGVPAAPAASAAAAGRSVKGSVQTSWPSWYAWISHVPASVRTPLTGTFSTR